jgi:hypothetical protein
VEGLDSAGNGAGVHGYRMFTGDEIVRDVPNVDWKRETQHLFRDNLRATASSLIISSPGQPAVVMDYTQFCAAFPHPLNDDSIGAFARLFAPCRRSLIESPIFWLRVVGYGYACADLVKSQGARLGFEARGFDVVALLADVDTALGKRGDPTSLFREVLAQGAVARTVGSGVQAAELRRPKPLAQSSAQSVERRWTSSSTS